MSREEPYYIPIPEEYGRRKLNALYREIPLKDTASRLLRKYLNAAANLYGIIPLSKLYGIITSQNKSLVTKEEFLAFAEIARHECEDYYILGKSELYYDGPETELMEYEVIDVQLIGEDLEPYHEILRGHQGKPYYVPDKKEFLAYDNPFHWENTPEAEAFRNFLLTKTTVPEDKLEAVFIDIYYGLHCMNAGFEDVMNRLDEIGCEVSPQSGYRRFCRGVYAVSQHVRMQYNRGHTPDELTAMYPPEERIPKSIPLPEHPSGHCGRNHESRRASARDSGNGDAQRRAADEFPERNRRNSERNKTEKGWPERSLPLRKREEIQKVLRTVMRMKIKLQTVIDAIEQASDAYTMLYDTKTNETVYLPDVWITGETDEDLAELIEKEPERFLRFPTKYEIHEYSIMDSFVDDLPAGRIKSELAGAIRGKGAFRRFKQTIRFQGVEQLWYDYQANAYRELAERWCNENDIQFE